MREIQNTDMYILSEIADKMDLQFPKMQKLPKNADTETISEARNEYGKELITMLIKKIHKAKNEINQLISNITEKPISEVEKMSIKETVNTLSNVLKQDGVLDFFK